VTAAITVVAALSMAGIPPFNGFYSKELLFEATYEVAHEAGGIAWLYPTVATLASVLTVVYSVKFLALFFGERRAPTADIHRPPIGLVGPPPCWPSRPSSSARRAAVGSRRHRSGAVDATATGEAQLEVGLPTHFSPPVAMSAVAVLGGFSAYPLRGRLAAGIRRGVDAPIPVRPSGWYDWIVSTAEVTSARFGSMVHNGLLRTYVGWVAAAGEPACARRLRRSGRASRDRWDRRAAGGRRRVGVATLAGVAVATATSHVSGVLTLSILGFMLAIFFIFASAPDLALTQLVVETLILLIFLLVLQRLPSFYSEIRPLSIARDAGVSILVGAMAFVAVLLTIPVPTPTRRASSPYYTEQAVPGGGGTNVVNVILVDFRAFRHTG